MLRSTARPKNKPNWQWIDAYGEIDPLLLMNSKQLIVCLAAILTCINTFAQNKPLFESIPSSKTGVSFKNVLKETPKSNVLTYEYFFNGGGTAVGDINNDGLDDIYFTANMASNKLYLNQGDFKFNDITK